MPFNGRRELLDKKSFYPETGVYSPFDHQQELVKEVAPKLNSKRKVLTNYTEEEFKVVFSEAYRIKRTLANQASKSQGSVVSDDFLTSMFSTDVEPEFVNSSQISASRALFRELTAKNPRLVEEKIRIFQG